MIKVSANSRTSAVAGAIAGVIRENKYAEALLLQRIRSSAVRHPVSCLLIYRFPS
ncbi:MAG: stage V sporulation protein S [Chloroflexota bacterium]